MDSTLAQYMLLVLPWIPGDPIRKISDDSIAQENTVISGRHVDYFGIAWESRIIIAIWSKYFGLTQADSW